MEIFLILALALIFALVPILIFFFKKKKLSKSQKEKFQNSLKKILSDSDERHQILDLDKLLDKILFTLSYKWTLWEKMKKFWKNFKNENEIWSAHKLRNKLAHELDFELKKGESEKAKKAFKIEIENLLKKF